MAEYTPYAAGTSVANIAQRAASYSMPGITVDGNDPIALYVAAGEAIDRARRGDGPTLLEAVTFRFFCGHYFGDQSEYIPEAEYSAALAADPIPRYRKKRLLDDGSATEQELDHIERAAREEVDDAAAWAFEQPLPPVSELTTDVYSKETL